MMKGKMPMTGDGRPEVPLRSRAVAGGRRGVERRGRPGAEDRWRPGATRRRPVTTCAVAILLVALYGCQEAAPPPVDPAEMEARVTERAARVLDANLAGLAAVTDSLDDILQPVAFLTPGEEAALRRYLQTQQLARARTLGARPADEAALDSLVAAGRLVELPDTTRYWVVRASRRSAAVVVPSVEILLTRVGERFHARLAEMGLPPWRMEISSILRTAGDQAALRRSNPNAAAGVSTHEFGTTLDVIYSAFTAPADPMVAFDAEGAEWLDPRLRWISDVAAERVAGRRSGELKAILGRVLREMQDEGLVMVTLERQQPVFHMTVARELDQR